MLPTNAIWGLKRRMAIPSGPSSLGWLVAAILGGANFLPWLDPRSPHGEQLCLGFNLAWLCGGSGRPQLQNICPAADAEELPRFNLTCLPAVINFTPTILVNASCPEYGFSLSGVSWSSSLVLFGGFIELVWTCLLVRHSRHATAGGPSHSHPLQRRPDLVARASRAQIVGRDPVLSLES